VADVTGSKARQVLSPPQSAAGATSSPAAQPPAPLGRTPPEPLGRTLPPSGAWPPNPMPHSQVQAQACLLSPTSQVQRPPQDTAASSELRCMAGTCAPPQRTVSSCTRRSARQPGCRRNRRRVSARARDALAHAAGALRAALGARAAAARAQGRRRVPGGAALQRGRALAGVRHAGRAAHRRHGQGALAPRCAASLCRAAPRGRPRRHCAATGGLAVLGLVAGALPRCWPALERVRRAGQAALQCRDQGSCRMLAAPHVPPL